MFFFSSILRSKVKDESEITLGRVKDVVVCIGKGENKEFPQVSGIIINGNDGKSKFIPENYIEEWGGACLSLLRPLNEQITKLPEGKDYLYLKNVLDKQIVDLSGVRLVRVNDLQFSRVRESLRLVSIDVSTLALFRRVGLPEKLFGRFIKPNFLQWKNVQTVGNKLQLSSDIKALTKLHPADIANIIEKLNVGRGSLLLQSLDQEIAARVLEEVQPEIKKMLVANLGAERAASLMQRMGVDEIVDLIQILPGSQAQDIIEKLQSDKKLQKVKKILEYDDDTAGGLMTTEYVHASPRNTVGEVLEIIKHVSNHFHSIQFVYIINGDGQYLGVISLRKLIVHDTSMPVRNIMKTPKRVPAVLVDKNLTYVATKMTKYNLSSIAVVNNNYKLLGVITVDDVMRRLLPKA